MDLATVSILDSGTWKFLIESKKKALQFMHRDLQTDTWEWTGNTNGIFTFQNCWEQMRAKFSDWPFYSISWFSHHCPKMYVFD